MTKSLLAIFVMAMLTCQQVQAFGATDVIKVFAGLMNGILHKDNLDYLLHCMSGTDALVEDVVLMVKHFKEGGATGIGEGIMDIGKFL